MTQNIYEKQNRQNINKISAEVVSMAAMKSALSVPGVNRLCDTFTDNITKMIAGKDIDNTGIRISKEKRSLIIDIFLVADFGAKIPQLAWEVQNAVKKAVEDITPLKVKEVNIHIQGVTYPQRGNNQ